jgi:hypothetical protein
MPSIRFTAAVAVAYLAVTICAYDDGPVCYSYGMDFQDGGRYFINIAATDNFTSVSQFTGNVLSLLDWM